MVSEVILSNSQQSDACLCFPADLCPIEPRGGSLDSWPIITVVQNILPPQSQSLALPSKSSNPIKIKGLWKTQDDKKVSGCNITLLQGSINEVYAVIQVLWSYIANHDNQLGGKRRPKVGFKTIN